MIENSRVEEKSFKGKSFRYVCVDRVVGDPSCWTFTDEDAVREEFWNVGEGDLVFDIGAAYGSYSLSALALGASHVFAWSPQGHPGSGPGEQEAHFFRESLALNGWSDRCDVYEEGLFDKRGWLNAATQEFFTEEPEKSGDVIFVRPFEEWFVAEFLAKGFALNHGKKAWVKLDVEGAEIEILHTLLRPLISPCSPNILVENHNFKRATMEQEVRDLITSWGYREVATRPYHSVSHSFYVA